METEGAQWRQDLAFLSVTSPFIWFLRRFSSEIRDALDGFVWTEDGRIVGNVTLTREDQARPIWIVSNVAVHPSYRRRGIARALMQHPEIVLADEPAASLDPQAGDEVMQLFASLMREEAKTVVFTSHNLSHALSFADRVIAIGGGRIVLDAPSSQLRESELRDLYT